MRRPAWGALVLLSALLAAPPVHAGCVQQKRAEVAIRIQDGFPLVSATIAGTPATLLLDTGAAGILLTPEAVQTLRLPPDPGRTTRLLGTGGSRDTSNVMLRGVSLGGAMLRDTSVPVAALPGVPRTEPPFAGLLGASLLAAYDVDIDLPRGRMALYDANGCSMARSLTSPPASVLPIEFSPEGEAFVAVQVNGERLLALIDTGSRATILSERAARRLGLGGAASANVARGVDGAAMPIRHLRVGTLQVGRNVVANAPVSVSPLQLGRGDMLLGLDYLGRRRMWISYRESLVVLGEATDQQR